MGADDFSAATRHAAFIADVAAAAYFIFSPRFFVRDMLIIAFVILPLFADAAIFAMPLCAAYAAMPPTMRRFRC